MIRTRKTEGIILKRTNYGEADRILTIYSKHFGKIRVVAKGARRITSRKAGSLESFNHVVLVLAKGKNLDIISEVQTINTFRSWRKNLLKVGIAWYLCELVDKLTPEEQENRQVFSLLRDWLAKIGYLNPSRLVRGFEEELLVELGFGVPEKLKGASGSLKSYIETIIEKKITTPKIFRLMVSGN